MLMKNTSKNYAGCDMMFMDVIEVCLRPGVKERRGEVVCALDL